MRALGAVLLLAGTASAQSVYQGSLSPAEHAEVSVWSALFWQRVDQGGGNVGAGFTFTNPAMAGHLFNPLRGARKTLETVAVLTPSQCDALRPSISDPGVIDEEIATAFRDVMIGNQITTDADTNPQGTYQHAMLIVSAAPDGGLVVQVNGNQLISIGLPLEALTEPPANSVLNYTLTPEAAQAVFSLFNAGAQWAAESGTVTESTKLITGQPSRADVFAEKVRTMLTGTLSLAEPVEVFYASFGVYGELPFVFVPLPGAYVLMDPVNGNLSGPFVRTSPIDPTGLLSAHPAAYTPTMGVRVASFFGCPVVDPPSWKNTPPCHTIVTTCEPPIFWAPELPGGEQWICFTQGLNPSGGLGCVCERRGTSPIGNPPVTVPVRRACVCAQGGEACLPGYQPGYPPIGCPPPSSCPTQFWW